MAQADPLTGCDPKLGFKHFARILKESSDFPKVIKFTVYKILVSTRLRA
jgi:hypothetical protein